MKRIFWQIMVFALCGVALLSFSATSQNARMGGFTPNNQVTISFPKSEYPVGATAPAEISISGEPDGKYTVSITDEDDDEVGSIELEIGGETGSNEGTVNIGLPGEKGEVTYTATVTIGEEEVSDSATLNVKADKQWKSGAKISGGELIEPANDDVGPIYGPYYVDEGGSLVFELAPGRDQDEWKLLSSGEEGEEADELTYTWNPAGHGEIVKREKGDRRITWKALPLPEGAGSVGETITCTIDDKPKEIPETEGGERGDGEKKISIMVYSVRRMWDAGTPIGEGRDAQGNTYQDGFLTAPFDYSNPDVSQKTLYAVGGASVPFAIAKASDWDKWSKYREVTPAEGHEADTITDEDYRWSVEGGEGTFVKLIGEDENGQALYSEPSGSITGREVIFRVPTDAKSNDSFTVKCEVSNDHGKKVSKPDGGDRVDTDKLERTQTIKIVDSSVKLALLKRADAPAGEPVSYEAVSGTAGGTVYGALEVLAGQGARVKSGRALVRLEETEEVEGEAHDDEESHVDVEVRFNETSGWQKWDGVAAVWADSPEAPTSAPAEGGHYRYLIPWNTASGKPGERLDEDGEMVSGTLLGHNGSHEVSLLSVDDEVEGQVTFTSANGGEFSAEAPEKVEVEVGNLVITEVTASDGNLDFIRYDPTSDDQNANSPRINFSLEDADYQAGDSYYYQVFFPETHHPTMPMIIGNADNVGPVSVPVPASMGAGVYTFGVIVTKQRTGDQQRSRSINRFFSATRIDVDEDNNESTFHYKVVSGASSQDTNTPLSQANIQSLNGAWENAGSAEGATSLTSESGFGHSVDVPESGNTEIGEGRVIVTGADNLANLYREHEEKRLLALNAVQRFYKIVFLNGPKSAPISALTNSVTQKYALSKGYMRRKVKGQASKFFWEELSNNAEPIELWRSIRNSGKTAKGNGSSNFLLVTTLSHSSPRNLVVSNVNGGQSGHNKRSWFIEKVFDSSTPEQMEQDFDLRNALSLVRVSSFLAIGCHSFDDQEKTNPIARYMAANKGAGNAVGFETNVQYFKNPGTLDRQPPQIWSDCFYIFGTLPEYNSSAKSVLDITKIKFDHYVAENIGPTSPNSMPGYGFWSASAYKMEKPILN